MAKTDSSSKMGMSAKNKILSVFATGWFAILSFIIIFPLIAGLIASFRPGTELIRRGLSVDFDFSTMTLNNYIYLFSGNADSQKYFMWFKNSLILTFVSVVGTLILCYIVAYGLTMYEYPLKNFLFFLVIATMMVPFEILILPLYKEMITLKLIDTTAGVVLPGICGATEYGICFKIMLPITKPAFVAMSILCAMNAWNNVLWPMLVYRSADKFTLPIGLNTLLTPYGNNYDVLIAGSMFGIIPVFIVFLCFQRYFIEGMTAGAVKG